jgi:hypothetical protein
MLLSSCNGGHGAWYAGNRDGREAAGSGAGAEFSLTAVAPGEHAAARGDSHAGEVAGRNGRGAHNGRDQDRYLGTGGGSGLGQFADSVVAPRVDRTGRGQGQAVVHPCGDGRNGCGPEPAKGQCYRRGRDGGRVVADLPVRVVAPGVDGTGRGEGQIMCETGRDAGDRGRERADEGRCRERRFTALAQLPRGAQPPGIDPAR